MSDAPWLSVVGIGEEGLPGLAPAARALVDAAEVLVGGDRHLAMLPPDARERLVWPSPLSALIGAIAERRGRRVCVLATGDPMHFGVGVTLARRFARDEMTIVPGVSAFSLAAARLGWPLAEVACLTLHGRPLELILPELQPGRRILALSHDGGTPAAVAALLRRHGWGPSRLVALAHMDGPEEVRVEATAAGWTANAVPDFNTLAIELQAMAQARPLPVVPGLPDDAFRHDGKLTKRAVRAATLAMLAPGPGQVLWDVGAGCGSVAIEWLRASPGGRALAIEPVAERRAMIADNALALGTPQLEVVDGRAPAVLETLPAPDAVFVGGGITAPGTMEACWQALGPGGRLVANVVTLQGEAEVLAWHGRLGGDLSRIAVSRAEPVGPFEGWKHQMTVTQLAATKPWPDTGA